MKEIADSDALSLEYKLKYGCATRDLNISDFVNNPVGAGVCRILVVSQFDLGSEVKKTILAPLTQ